MPFDFTTGLNDVTDFNMNLQDFVALKGDDGLSAYQVALNNGFKGTEQEWLDSLKGEDGKDGIDGKDGQTYDDTEIISRIAALESASGGGSGGDMTIERGTWTPTLLAESGTAPTYEMPYHYSSYYRINNLVYITFYLKANISDAGSGFCRVGGLPFKSAKGVGQQGLVQHIMNATQATSSSANIPDDTSFITIRSGTGVASIAWKTGNVFVGYSGWYLID